MAGRVIINLAGAPIFERWTPQYKKILYDSRIVSTRNIVEAIPAEDSGMVTLINASAIGYYGFQEDGEVVETAGPGRDFLAGLCLAWENEALKAQAKGVRVCVIRIAPVLGNGGGALAKMLPLFQKGLGGRIGHGRQWFTWIHIDDLCGAVVHLLDHSELAGPVNLAAPGAVRNLELTAALSLALNKPAFLPVPAFALKLALGEMSSALLEGCRVVPEVLTRTGFAFQYPDLDKALQELLHSQ